MSKKLQILVLTSMPIRHSANLGLDMVKSLQERGHHVDILTKYKDREMLPNVYSVYDQYRSPSKPKRSSQCNLCRKFPFLNYLNLKKYFRKPTHYKITNKVESKPRVDVALVVASIRGEYDLVITLFWQSMITAATLKGVYDKLKCPIFIQAVDMFPMTGGCFYFWNCRNFMVSCGKCPGLFSHNEKDQTHKNFLLKKDIYSSIDSVFIGNTWMCEWAQKSPLFAPMHVKKGGLAINQEAFVNHDKQEARLRLKLPPHKRFILFAGAPNLTEERKGFTILVEAIERFTKSLSAEDKNSMLLILAGNIPEDIQKYFQIEIYNPGFLDIPKLALTYAASDVYLSTTIEDAGPTMVSQSLLCGCPVVAFEVGVALDIVETHVTGYRAQYKDVDDYVQGIRYIYLMDSSQRESMSQYCRAMALKESSYASFATRMEQIYEEHLMSSKID